MICNGSQQILHFTEQGKFFLTYSINIAVQSCSESNSKDTQQLYKEKSKYQTN